MAERPYDVIFFDLGDTLVFGRDWVYGARQTLTRVGEAGFRLGLISNTGDWDRDRVLDELPIDFELEIFEENLVVFSSEVGVAKPDPAIFELAVERAGVPASRCLFCSEDALHGLAAQHAGLRFYRCHAHPFNDIDRLAGHLAELAELL